MSPRPDSASGRAFFLARSPADGVPELEPEDAAHARRVLRLGPGDALTGLDGVGGRWPLRVTRSSGGAFEVEAAGEPERVPAPGDAGAPPRVEVAACLPREKRAEAMLERLVQLGAAVVTPLWAERSQGPLRELSESRLRRLRRVAREACKQCERAWAPELGATTAPLDLVAARPDSPVALLDPDADESLLAWARALPPEAGRTGSDGPPIVLLVGPEGGFTRSERDALVARGARPVRVAPHVLRVETAAEAGLAALVLALEAEPLA